MHVTLSNHAASSVWPISGNSFTSALQCPKVETRMSSLTPLFPPSFSAHNYQLLLFFTLWNQSLLSMSLKLPSKILWLPPDTMSTIAGFPRFPSYPTSSFSTLESESQMNFDHFTSLAKLLPVLGPCCLLSG